MIPIQVVAFNVQNLSQIYISSFNLLGLCGV